MSRASDPRLYAPHVPRNRDPILAVLRRVLPSAGLILEVGSGSGEHAAYFAKNLPLLSWQPTDSDPRAIASIAGHRTAIGVPNLLAPLHLDVTARDWPIARADALVCINMIHIAPWQAAESLMAGAERILRGGGLLYLYGPYRMGGRHTAASNQEFDAWLRTQDARWGVRDLDAVVELAADHGLSLIETARMPANNLSVAFRRNG